jgi:hypothetical protein
MNNAKKTFISGLNADDSFFSHKKEDNLDALNARVITSKEGKAGSVSNIVGNRLITNTNIVPAGSKVIGVHEDPTTNNIFYFTTNTNGDHRIFCYDELDIKIYVVLADGDFGGTYDLNFSLTKPITGISYIDGLLYWTGPDNKEPSKINVDRGILVHDPSYITTETAYELPIKKHIITVIKKPPFSPISIEVLEDSNRDTSFIKPQAHTFAYRYVYKDGETSVFSPTSDYYPHQNMANKNHRKSKKINLTIPSAETISDDVRKIQVGVKYDSDSSYFIIKEYHHTHDATVINAHNSGTDISFDYFNDMLGNPVNDSDSVKLYDTVPHHAEALAIARNRLFLGNITSGRVNPVKLTTSHFSLNQVQSNVLASTSTISSTERTDGGTRGFSSASSYQFGIAFYDFAGRSGGVLTDENFVVVTPERSEFITTYTSSVNWTLTSTSDIIIPEWAHHYSILRTKNLTKDFTLSNLSNKVRYYTFDSNNSFTVNLEKVDDDGDPTGKFSDNELISFNKNYKGIAIGLGDLSTYQLGYSYQEGDRIKLIKGTEVFDFAITSTAGEFVLVNLKNLNSSDFLNTGTLANLDYNIRYEIYSPHKIAQNEFFYETNNFYPIENPGTTTRTFSVKNGSTKGGVYLKNRKAELSNEIPFEYEYYDDSKSGNNNDLRNKQKYVEFPSFYGTGSNDLSVVDNTVYSGVSDDLRIEIVIDGNGTPDTFKYRVMSSPTNVGTYFTNVSCSTSTITLAASAGSVQIQFASTTGHTIGDRWTINAKDQNSGPVSQDDDHRALPSFHGQPNDVILVGTEITFDVKEWAESNQEFTYKHVATRTYDNLEELYWEDQVYNGTEWGITHSRIAFRRGTIVKPNSSSKLNILGDDGTASPAVVTPSLTDGTNVHMIVQSLGYENNFLDGDPKIRLKIRYELPDAYEYDAETMNPSDDYFLRWIQITGRPNISVQDVEQQKKTTGISFSETKIPGSKINGLSKFSALDEDQLDEVTGPLRKLALSTKTQSTGTILLAISENETTSIYLGEEQLQGASSGNQFLSVSSKVIGTKNSLQGSYGTLNPESVVVAEGNVYWFDVKNETVLSYSQNGLLPIGDLKMKTFFSDKSKLVVDNKFVPATFDAYNNEYILTLPSGEGYEVVLQENPFLETNPSTTFTTPATQPANKVITVIVPAPWSVAINASLVDGVATFSLDSPYRFKINSPSITNFSGMTLSNASSGGFTTTVESGVTYYNPANAKLQITGVQDNQDFPVINIERNDGLSNNEITASILRYAGTFDSYEDNPVSHTGTVYQATGPGLHSTFGSKVTASSGQVVIPITSTHPWTLYTDGNHLGTNTIGNNVLEFFQAEGSSHTNIPIADISVSNTAIGSIGFAAGAGNITVSNISDSSTRVEFRAQKLIEAIVSTDAETNISSTGFTMNGNYSSAGDGTATTKGFVYSSSSINPDLGSGTDCVVSGTSTGTFSKVLTGLSNSTSYYYRAYVINEIGTVYGATQTVTTFGASTTTPTVTTNGATAISSARIKTTGSYSTDGGATVTEAGAVISSTATNPIIGATGVTKVVAASGTSSPWLADATGLNASTLYYVKAYATNVNGTAYGSVVQVTTPAAQGGVGSFVTTTTAISPNGGTIYFQLSKTTIGAVSGGMTVRVMNGSQVLNSDIFTISIGSSGTTQQFFINAPANVHTQSRTLYLQIQSMTGVTFDNSLPFVNINYPVNQPGTNIP